MLDQIAKVRESFGAALDGARSRQDFEQVRIRFLARKGAIAELFEALKSAAPSEKPALGKALNELRRASQVAFEERMMGLAESSTAAHTIDLTLPGRPRPVGTKHPITQTIEEIKRIFTRMGFETAEGPEIESDYYNFESLNFPPDHPARDMQDTFFINDELLLRTHTSPVQIRVMESRKPPVRIIVPGRVFRNEAVSARSHVMFHQIEGLYVDKGVTFGELKGTLVAFVKQYFGSGVKYKFRPTFFPFTEPSADMYISCFICGGGGCRVCKQNGWLEILGSGMVHPNVFTFVGYDPELYTGYAFGLGIDRIAMLKYGIDDIRLFYENDVRFLGQF
jgi:phenylalanyl-tRNA synthetase alpha chain